MAPLSWCKAPDIGIPKPDKVFYLELSALKAEKRAVYGEERYEKVTFQQQVEKQFEELRAIDDDWRTLDASRTIDNLHEQILAESLAVTEVIAHLPIAKLWTDDLD